MVSRAPRSRRPVRRQCSRVGTVRAFDLVRYRNFRTFTSPMPAQVGHARAREEVIRV